MKALVWALDDEPKNLETIRHIFEEDSWIWEHCDATCGIELREFDESNDVEVEIARLNSADAFPCLALFDANLSGKSGDGDNYGGFRVWRRFVDRWAELTKHFSPPRPTVAIYTRDPVLVHLAAHLQTAPAQPLVVPFASSVSEETRQFLPDGARPCLNALIEPVLHRLLLSRVRSLEPHEREQILTALLSDKGCLALTVDGIPLHRLCPREMKAIISGTDDRAACLARLRSILLANGHSFRSALGELGSFLMIQWTPPCRKDDLRANDILQHATRCDITLGTKASLSFRPLLKSVDESAKLSHIFNKVKKNTLTLKEKDIKLLECCFWEAAQRWGPVLSDPLNHPYFYKSSVWQAIECSVGKAWSDRMTCVHEWMSQQKSFGNWVTSNAQSPFLTLYDEPVSRELAILKKDWDTIINALSSQGTVADCQGMRTRAWIGGIVVMGYHWLIKMQGISDFDYSRVRDTMIAPCSPGSLSEAADYICRVYRGQLLVGVTDSFGTGIDLLLARFPGRCYVEDVTSIVKKSFMDQWAMQLKEQREQVFNIVSFEALV